MPVKQFILAPPFRGMDFSVDGALLSKDVLQLAINARFDKGAVTRRQAVTSILGPAYNMPVLTIPNNASANVDFVSIPLHSAFVASASMTVSFWFRWNGTSVAGTTRVMACEDSGGSEVAWRLDSIHSSGTARTLRATIHTVAGDLTLDTAALTASTWYWITFGADDQGTNLYAVIYVNGLISDVATNASNMTTNRDHVELHGHVGAESISYSFRTLRLDTIGPMVGGYVASEHTLGSSIQARFQDVGVDVGGTGQQYVFKDTSTTVTDSIFAEHGTYNGAAATNWAATPTFAMQQALYSPKPFLRDDNIYEDSTSECWVTAAEGIYRADLSGTLGAKILRSGLGQTDHAAYSGVQYLAPGDGKLYQYHADTSATSPNIANAKIVDWLHPMLNSDGLVPFTVASVAEGTTGLSVLDNGDYVYKLTTHSTYTGESSPVFYTSGTVVVSTGKSIEITFGAFNPSNAHKPQITHIDVWRTKVNATSGPFYLEGRYPWFPDGIEITNGMIIDSTNDINLSTTTLPTGTTTLPTINRIAVYRDRLWGASGADANLYYSAIGDVWKWDTTANNIQIGEDDDPITRLIEFNNALLIFKRDSIYVLRGVTDADFTVDPLSEEIGCPHSWSLTRANGEIYWIGTSTAYRMAGFQIEDIGAPISHFLESATTGTSVGAFDPVSNRVIFGVYYNARWDDAGQGTAGDRCDLTLTYDVTVRSWAVDTVPLCGLAAVPVGMTFEESMIGIVDATFISSGPNGAGASRLVRFLDQHADYADTNKIGVAPTQVNATNIQLAGEWTGTETGRYLAITDRVLNPSDLYDLGALRRITAATTGQLDVGATYQYRSPSGSGALQRFCVGAIPVVLETGWLDFGNPGRSKRLQHIVLHWDESLPNPSEATREHVAYVLLFNELIDPWEYEGDTDTFTVFDGTGKYKPRDLFLSTFTSGLEHNARYVSNAQTGLPDTNVAIQISTRVQRVRSDMFFRWLKCRILVPHAPRDFALRALEFHYTEGGL